ncbi:MAG: MgtC/SapB family protein [Candidatus Pacebacteria bacterium]|nr:MgtC/SapB family protein [Candidatus Paceibacterota bacterium]
MFMSLESLTPVFFQLFLAAVLGMAVGFERWKIGKPAGMKTYALVSLGSALFTILSVSGFSEFVGSGGYDPSRLASQVVVGVGFLGAGIIFSSQKEVHGLTTAAAIWVSAAVGTAVGLKFYAVAVFTAMLTVFILWFLRLIESKVPRAEGKDEIS